MPSSYFIILLQNTKHCDIMKQKSIGEVKMKTGIFRFLSILLITLTVLLLSCCQNKNDGTEVPEDKTEGVQTPDTPTEDNKEPEHVHTFGEWTDNTATCTEGGTEKRYCLCGESEERVTASFGHIGGEVEIVENVPATCTADGYYVAATPCIRCKALLSEEVVTVDKLEHTYGRHTIENVVESTCVSAGSHDEVVYCLICDYELERKSVVDEMRDHSAIHSTEENYIDSTCTSEGSYERVDYCLDCKQEVSRTAVVIPVKAHTGGTPVKEDEKAPTCKVAGYYYEVLYCTECDVEISRTKITVARIDHIAGDPVRDNVVEPTCAKDGSYREIIKCTMCSRVISATTKILPATGEHIDGDFGIISETQPTCSAEGSQTGYVYCAVCGLELRSETRIIEKTEHVAGVSKKENKVSSTCTEPGSYDTVRYCRVCNAEVSRVTTVIDPLSHQNLNKKENNVEPTCTEQGSYDSVYYCGRCGLEHSRTKMYIDALGHIESTGMYEIEYVESDCTTHGYVVRCSRCTRCQADMTYERETLPLKHSTMLNVMTETIVSATCTESGTYDIVKSCSLCGAEVSRESKISGPLGHREDNPVTENNVYPTCVSKEYFEEVIYCRRCKCELSRTYHEYDYGTHEYESVSVNRAPTCTKEGAHLYEFTCKYCGDYYENIIYTTPAVGHNKDIKTRANYVAGGKCTDGGYDIVSYCGRCGEQSGTEHFLLNAYHKFSGCVCADCGYEVVTNDGLEFKLNSDGLGYTLIGLGNCTDADIRVGMYNGLPVTNIGENIVGTGCIYSIELSGYVTNISWTAFDYCYELVSVSLGTSVKTIGKYAFRSCTSLEHVVATDSLVSIGECAFQSCPIETIELPDTLVSIGVMAFYDTALSTVNIPAGVSNVHYTSFAGISTLKEIRVNDESPYYMDIDGNLYSKDGKEILLYIVGENERVLNILDGVEILYELINSERLEELYLPSGFRDLHHSGSLGGLRKISIPESIEFVNSNFNSGVLEYNLYGNLKYLGNESSPYLVLCGTSDDTVKEVITHADTKIIMRYAFNGMSGIERVVLNEGLRTINTSAFNGTSITEIVIPDSVKTMEDVFLGCEMLQSVVIGSGVAKIESYTFSGCTSLTIITIRGKLGSVGMCAFRSCSSITDVYFNGTAEEWENIEIDVYNNSYFTKANIHYS